MYPFKLCQHFTSFHSVLWQLCYHSCFSRQARMAWRQYKWNTAEKHTDLIGCLFWHLSLQGSSDNKSWYRKALRNITIYRRMEKEERRILWSSLKFFPFSFHFFSFSSYPFLSLCPESFAPLKPKYFIFCLPLLPPRGEERKELMPEYKRVKPRRVQKGWNWQEVGGETHVKMLEDIPWWAQKWETALATEAFYVENSPKSPGRYSSDINPSAIH